MYIDLATANIIGKKNTCILLWNKKPDKFTELLKLLTIMHTAATQLFLWVIALCQYV